MSLNILWRAGDEAVAMTMLSLAVEKLMTMARTDQDREVVMVILDSANEMLADIKQPLLSALGSLDAVISIINDVFKQKVIGSSALTTNDIIIIIIINKIMISLLLHRNLVTTLVLGAMRNERYNKTSVIMKCNF